MTPELFSAGFGTVRFLRDGQRYISGMLISSDRVYNLRFRKERKAMAN